MSRSLHELIFEDERREAGILRAVHLPEDVLRLIFDYVHESSFMWYHHTRAAACYKDLLSCTLVCRDWRSPASYALYRWICVPRRRRFKHSLDAFSALLRTLYGFAASDSRALSGTSVLELDVHDYEPRARASNNSSSSDSDDDAERDADYPTFRLLAAVLSLLPRLRKLSLIVHQPHDIILPAVFRSHLTDLRLTHLRVCYADDEEIQPGLQSTSNNAGTLIRDCLTIWSSITHLDISTQPGTGVHVDKPWSSIAGLRLRDIRLPREAVQSTDNILSASTGGSAALRTAAVTIDCNFMFSCTFIQPLFTPTLHTLELSLSLLMHPTLSRELYDELPTMFQSMTALRRVVIGECKHSFIDRLIACIPTWVRDLGVIYTCDDRRKCASPQWVVALLQRLEAPHRVVVYVAWPLTQPRDGQYDEPSPEYSCEDAQRDARAFYHPAEVVCSARGIQFDIRPY
ncbi:hypothetical protein EXIGLDRAFT_734494, partial [Exidia glandulosa HHB12029]